MGLCCNGSIPRVVLLNGLRAAGLHPTALVIDLSSIKFSSLWCCWNLGHHWRYTRYNCVWLNTDLLQSPWLWCSITCPVEFIEEWRGWNSILMNMDKIQLTWIRTRCQLYFERVWELQLESSAFPLSRHISTRSCKVFRMLQWPGSLQGRLDFTGCRSARGTPWRWWQWLFTSVFTEWQHRTKPDTVCQPVPVRSQLCLEKSYNFYSSDPERWSWCTEEYSVHLAQCSVTRYLSD